MKKIHSASEYARTHPEEKILVIDLCPQANGSGILLGGMEQGEHALNSLSTQGPRKTISGYIEDRILSPYVNPNVFHIHPSGTGSPSGRESRSINRNWIISNRIFNSWWRRLSEVWLSVFAFSNLCHSRAATNRSQTHQRFTAMPL